MDLLREKLKARGGMGATLSNGGGGGGGSTSTTGAQTTTNNTDRRNAVQDGIAVSGDGSGVSYSSTSNSTSVTNTNSTDAVKAIAQAGADIIKSSGGAVVELGRFQAAQNTAAWDATLTNGSKLIDKLIDKVGDGFNLSGKVIDSFQPSENKQTDALKYGLIAAAVVAAAVLLKGQK